MTDDTGYADLIRRLREQSYGYNLCGEAADALEAAVRERDKWRENAQIHDEQAQKYSRRAWDAEAALEAAESERDRLAKLADKWRFRATQGETKLADANAMIDGFLKCAEISDCDPEDIEPQTQVLERTARRWLAQHTTAQRKGGGDDHS